MGGGSPREAFDEDGSRRSGPGRGRVAQRMPFVALDFSFSEARSRDGLFKNEDFGRDCYGSF